VFRQKNSVAAELFLKIINQNLSITFPFANLGEVIGLVFVGEFDSAMCSTVIFGILTSTDELGFGSVVSTELTS
jgi:hypothetical protein